MSISPSVPMTLHDYDVAAEEYLRSLPLEHFMEATPHATQREITVESMRLLKMQRPDLHYFNELLVQYPAAGGIGQVVPDNMLVLGDLPARDRTNFPAALEPAPPFMVLEYVSPSTTRKDYRDSFAKYENELRPRYCLFFDPLSGELRVFRHDGRRYERLAPDGNGRIAIPELELEIAVLDRWARFWHRGELLRLPDELAQQMEVQSRLLDQQAAQIEQQAGRLEKQSAQIKQQAVQIEKQALELERQKDALGALAALLRRQVEKRAAAAGRRDILDQLPAVSDARRLEAWLEELP